MVHANIRNNEIIDFNSKYANEDILRVETTEEMYQAYLENKNKVIYQDGQIVENPNYKDEQAQKERERLDMLYLTGTDVERGIYHAKGMDFDDMIEMVETMQFAEETQAQKIDLKALKIELKANHFYRGNPYVNAVGSLLGFTSDQLDKFFETNDYTYLMGV